ncbi:hypothetical protein CY34DRAFT_803877 [Suillus luteus UH-Slu-Lm8-n1]|uniref:Unplaced genomic scaffold CY34scaffold_83, whole genome shotgun sequence n=1 Tax=Suillus luteus UH-Slu-Lm8-n1 TaxID=930992 RepID=A0A0D0BJF2_9AGAM|nr:hypothetical protein CY34DRAFT_803877 [Suillus luteus UH-Slu-Lm8-n1]
MQTSQGGEGVELQGILEAGSLYQIPGVETDAVTRGWKILDLSDRSYENNSPMMSRVGLGCDNLLYVW